MVKPWMPVVAGLLDIVSGALGVVVGLFMSLRVFALKAAQSATGAAPRVFPHAGTFPQMPHMFFPGMGIALGIALLVIGILAIVGGVYALRFSRTSVTSSSKFPFSNSPVFGSMGIIPETNNRSPYRIAWA